MAEVKLMEYVVLGRRESLNVTVTFLPLAWMVGGMACGGERTMFFCALRSWMYSLKESSTSLGRALVALRCGEQESSVGAVTSLGPPCGPPPLLAHPTNKPMKQLPMKKDERTLRIDDEIILNHAKLDKNQTYALSLRL